MIDSNRKREVVAVQSMAGALGAAQADVPQKSAWSQALGRAYEAALRWLAMEAPRAELTHDSDLVVCEERDRELAVLHEVCGATADWSSQLPADSSWKQRAVYRIHLAAKSWLVEEMC